MHLAWTAEHHGLNCDPGSEGQHGAPLRQQAPAPAQLVEHEDDGRAAHVAVLAEHVPAGPQLLRLQLEHLVYVVQDGAAARVHRPEEVVPLPVP